MKKNPAGFPNPSNKSPTISSFFGIDFYIAMTAKFRHLGLKERGPSKTGVANDGVCFKNGQGLFRCSSKMVCVSQALRLLSQF